MKIKIFSLPAMGDEVVEDAFNLFIAQHRIVQVDRHLIQNGADSYWSICVGYHNNKPPARSKSSRIDYREILSTDQFRDYAALREWRKSVAEREGVPVFGVFSNEQMSQIVQLSELTLAALASIDGIGQVKCERYASEVFALLQKRRVKPGESVSPADSVPA